MGNTQDVLAALEQFRGRHGIRAAAHRSADTPAVEAARSPEMRLATAESRLRSPYLSDFDQRRYEFAGLTAMAEIRCAGVDQSKLSYSERLAMSEMPEKHRASIVQNDSYTQRRHLAQAKVASEYAIDPELRDEFFSRIPDAQQRQVAEAMAGDYARRAEQARLDDQFERAEWLQAREGEMAYRAEGYRLRDAGQQQDFERHRGHRFEVEQETDRTRDAAFAHDHAFALENEQAKERAAERAAQQEAMKGRFEAGAEVNGFASAATATASSQADISSIEEMSRGEFDAPKREMPRAGADQHQRQQRDAQQAAEHQADRSQELQRARGPAPDHSKVALETVFSHSELRAMQQRARQQEQGKAEPRYGTPEWRNQRQKEFLEQPYQRQVKHWQDKGYKTEVDLANKRVLVRGDDDQLKFVDSGRKGIQFRTNDPESAKLAMETMRERGHESVQYRPAAAATQEHQKEALALADRAGMKVENRQDVERDAGIERKVDVHKWRAGEEREIKPAATATEPTNVEPTKAEPMKMFTQEYWDETRERRGRNHEHGEAIKAALNGPMDTEADKAKARVAEQYDRDREPNSRHYVNVALGGYIAREGGIALAASEATRRSEIYRSRAEEASQEGRPEYAEWMLARSDEADLRADIYSKMPESQNDHRLWNSFEDNSLSREDRERLFEAEGRTLDAREKAFSADMVEAEANPDLARQRADADELVRVQARDNPEIAEALKHARDFRQIDAEERAHAAEVMAELNQDERENDFGFDDEADYDKARVEPVRESVVVAEVAVGESETLDRRHDLENQALGGNGYTYEDERHESETCGLIGGEKDRHMDRWIDEQVEADRIAREQAIDTLCREYPDQYPEKDAALEEFGLKDRFPHIYGESFSKSGDLSSTGMEGLEKHQSADIDAVNKQLAVEIDVPEADLAQEQVSQPASPQEPALEAPDQPQPEPQRPMSAIELRRARMAEQDQARGVAPDAERAKSATAWAEQSLATEQQVLAEQQRQRNKEQGLSHG